jgi:P4 family phage/plasmid primase-like protien
MTAVRWFEKGFTDIISVVPPFSQVSENSDLKTKDLGKCPGQPTVSGWAGIPNWLNFETTRADCQFWDNNNSNIGLRSARFPGIDIDVIGESVDLTSLSNLIRDLGLEIFGPTAIRYGNRPKQLLMYRTEDDIPTRTVTFSYGDDVCKVEVLAKGRQYVIEGLHPKGLRYEINQEIADSSSLRLITNEQVDLFLDRLVNLLGSQGCTFVSRHQATGREHAPPDAVHLAKDLDLLEQAVTKTPNNLQSTPDWDHWMKYGAALHAATAEDRDRGLSMWLDFSSRAEHQPYDFDQAQKIWNGFRPPYLVGADYLYRHASKFGSFNYALSLDSLPVISGDIADLTYEPYSHGWMADSFLQNQGSRLRYVPDWKRFIYRAEDVWVLDNQANTRISTDVSEYIKQKMADVPAHFPDDEDEVRSVRKQISNNHYQQQVYQMLRDRRHSIVVSSAELDLNPNILNTPKGKYSLKTGKLIEETFFGETDYCLKSTRVTPDFEMETPVWNQFLKNITMGDSEMVWYLQLCCGYAATGRTDEHILQIVYGFGGNGKTTFCNVLLGVLGDYATVVPGELFLRTAYQAHPTELMTLKGRRLVVAVEFDEKAVWDSGKLKKLTGGDRISARLMKQDYVEFEPTHTVMIASNNKPKIESLDQAIRRRVRLIPFDLKLPEENQDKKLKDKLKQEYPGILAWLIQGAGYWYQFGLPLMPQRVSEATADYFEESDVLAKWMEDCCERTDKHREKPIDLYRNWETYCKMIREAPGSPQQFAEQLKKREFRRVKSNGYWFYEGLRIKASELVN